MKLEDMKLEATFYSETMRRFVRRSLFAIVSVSRTI
jgi:hypothetical protein